ncbi:MAG: hypothetical protein ACXW19_02225 [Thermoanaerobaculia bacterium]
MVNGSIGRLRAPASVPEYSVVSDTPEKLVLQIGASRWITASILFAFGAVLIGASLVSRMTLPGVLGGLCVAGAIFFALSRRRWTFDARRRTVRFESFWSRWEEKLTSVNDLSVSAKSHGSAGNEIAVFMLMIDVNSRCARINASVDRDFIDELKSRLDAMIDHAKKFAR